MTSLLSQSLVYLGAALVMVPLTHRLGLGSVLGYLVAGLLIGPSILGWIPTSEAVLHFSEFGVVMLLFLVGLELSPKRLWEMRRSIFGLGLSQVVVTALVITLGLVLFGAPKKLAIVAGLGLAMSSTALVLQMFAERGFLKQSEGQAGFSILLFQDLAVIPMLALLPIAFSTTQSASLQWSSVAIGIGAIAGVLLGGRFLVGPLFRWAAATQLREVFTALALGLVIGISLLMSHAGLSMALGTFLAGVVLAESEYRHELEIDIEPFKGLLLGLFFIAVGMSMDLQQLVLDWKLVISGVLGLMLVKATILYALSRFFGELKPVSATVAVALCQGGEFAFVLFSMARELGAVSPEQTNLLNGVVAVSIALTPIFFKIYEAKLRSRWFSSQATPELGEESKVKNLGHKVILAGYGRVGQGVGRLLHTRGVGVTVLEQDPTQIEVVKRFGWGAFYGDVSRLEMLESAGAKDAELLILAIDDMEAAQKTIDLVKEHFPHLKVLVRAESRLDAYRFSSQGLTTARVTMSAALSMAEQALRLIGTPAREANQLVAKFKAYDQEMFERAVPHLGNEKELISISKLSREELTRLMAEDRKKEHSQGEDGWA